MRQTLLFVMLITSSLSAASTGAVTSPEMRAAVACSKAALRERAVASQDPAEVVAKAAFVQCMAQFQVAAARASAEFANDPRSTSLSRGVDYQMALFGLFAGYMPLAVEMVDSLRAASRS